MKKSATVALPKKTPKMSVKKKRLWADVAKKTPAAGALARAKQGREMQIF